MADEEKLNEDEAYLTEEQTQHLKEIMEVQIREMMTQANETVNDLVEVREMAADELDIAIDESSRDFALRIADRDRKLVGKLRKALDRIHSGEYGVCESCGGPISYRRLVARPVATQCIDCKTEAEQMQYRGRPSANE
jgi:DnaK suppressor protein